MADGGRNHGRKGVTPINEIDTLQKAALAANFAEEKKAEEITILDVRGLCNFADAFLICTGNNRIQLNAICEGIAQGFKKMGYKTPRDERDRSAGWMILDYGDLVIHVMSSESRAFYGLERLWGDAREVELDGVELPAGSRTA